MLIQRDDDNLARQADTGRTVGEADGFNTETTLMCRKIEKHFANIS